MSNGKKEKKIKLKNITKIYFPGKLFIAIRRNEKKLTYMNGWYNYFCKFSSVFFLGTELILLAILLGSVGLKSFLGISWKISKDIAGRNFKASFIPDRSVSRRSPLETCHELRNVVCLVRGFSFRRTFPFLSREARVFSTGL